MSHWIDRKWINNVSPHLELFSWTGNDVANFRCNVCGDSKKKKTLKRGFFLWFNDTFFYKCHNCGYSMPLGAYLKDYFPSKYREYLFDTFKDSPSNKRRSSSSTHQQNPDAAVLFDCKYASYLTALNAGHPAIEYCESRMIPVDRYSDILYCADFNKFVKSSIHGKYEEKYFPGDQRIIFLMKDFDKTVIGLQARSILDDSDVLKFVTLKLDDKKPKMFGLNKLNPGLPIFVVESIIDSIQLPNALAICGGDISESINTSLGGRGVNPKNIYVSLDNEPRKPDTIKRMDKAIANGYNVTFWSIDSLKYNDINDMMTSGQLTVHDILAEIKHNSFNGLQAKNEMVAWKKTR